MAYLEQDGRSGFNPGGFAATLLLNGAMIAVIATYAPSGGKAIVDWFPGVVTLTPEAPPPPPDPAARKEERKSPETPTPFSPPVTNPGPIITTNPLGVDTADLTPPVIPLPPGDIRVDPTPLPPVPNPVRIGPKLDSRYASTLQPAYPPGKARDEVEGSVTVRVLIGPDGRVKQVEPVGAADPDFFEATRRQALSKWRFKPATLDGSPVEGWKEMTVHFRMQS